MDEKWMERLTSTHDVICAVLMLTGIVIAITLITITNYLGHIAKNTAYIARETSRLVEVQDDGSHFDHFAESDEAEDLYIPVQR